MSPKPMWKRRLGNNVRKEDKMEIAIRVTSVEKLAYTYTYRPAYSI
jgi:hypothetical protein